MEMSNNDISTFLNMVDTFYNNAWNRLVLYGALIIVIAGIVIPIILQFMSQRVQQSKNIEMENKLREELTNSIDLEVGNIEEKNKKFIDSYFSKKEKTIKDMLIKLENRISFSIGLNYHNLAIRVAKEGKIPSSILYSISAGLNYLNAEDETNLKIILKNIEENYLKIDKIKNSFEVEEVKKDLNNFISKLEEKFPDKRYSLEIMKIKKSIFNVSKIKK